MDINSQIEEVLAHYEGLSFNEAKNAIEGELLVSKDDSYDISIILAPYPKDFPRVFEMGERIPRKVTRHIYSDTSSCCLSTQAKAQILLKTQITSLYLFVKEIVVPYFQNNSFYEINGHYNGEEYSHNKMGIIESYRDILQTNNDLHIAKLIYNRINHKKLKIHDPCYCGSGHSIKKCNHARHYTCYKNFRKIDLDVLQNDLHLFIKILEERDQSKK